VKRPTIKHRIAIGTSARGNVNLAANNGANPSFAGSEVEVCSAIHDTVIGKSDGFHLKLAGALKEIRDAAKAVEQTEFAMDM
jgi:hypothetical protein